MKLIFKPLTYISIVALALFACNSDDSVSDVSVIDGTNDPPLSLQMLH